MSRKAPLNNNKLSDKLLLLYDDISAERKLFFNAHFTIQRILLIY